MHHFSANTNRADPTLLSVLLLVHFGVFVCFSCVTAVGMAIHLDLAAFCVLGATQLLFTVPGYFGCYRDDASKISKVAPPYILHLALVRIYAAVAIFHGAVEVIWAIYGIAVLLANFYVWRLLIVISLFVSIPVQVRNTHWPVIQHFL